METVGALEALPSPDGAMGDASKHKKEGRVARGSLTLFVGGRAAVAAGIGTYFALDVSWKWSSAHTHCPVGGACDADGASLSQDAGTAADRATVSFAVAAAAAVVTVALWIISPQSADTANKAGLRFVPTRDGGGFRIRS